MSFWTGAGGAAISAGGGLLGGLFNMFGAAKQRKHERQMLAKQQEYQKELLTMENDMSMANQREIYETQTSPIAQRAAQKAAGVNPFAQGAGIQSMQTSAPEASAPSVPDLPQLPNPMAGFGEAIRQASIEVGRQVRENELLDAQVDEVKSRTLNNLLDADNKEYQKTLRTLNEEALRHDVMTKKFRVEFEKWNAKVKEIESNYAESERAAQLSIAWAQFDDILSRTAKTDAEKRLIEKQVDYFDTDKKLAADRIKSEIGKNESSAAVDDATRYKLDLENRVADATEFERIRIIQAEADKLNSQIRQAKANADSAEARAELERIHTEYERWHDENLRGYRSKDSLDNYSFRRFIDELGNFVQRGSPFSGFIKR